MNKYTKNQSVKNKQKQDQVKQTKEEKEKKNRKVLYYSLVVPGLFVVTVLAYIVGWFAGSLLGDSTSISVNDSVDNLANPNGQETSKTLNKLDRDTHKEKQDDIDTNTYQNEEFDFQLTLKDSWKDYKAVTSTEKTDFGVGVVNFYLPTEKEQEFTDYPGYIEGYVNLFSIGVYDKEGWEDPERDKEFDDMYGEVIAENNKYVFVYSHLNGDPPSDISRQVTLDMEKIAKSIEFK